MTPSDRTVTPAEFCEFARITEAHAAQLRYAGAKPGGVVYEFARSRDPSGCSLGGEGRCGGWLVVDGFVGAGGYGACAGENI